MSDAAIFGRYEKVVLLVLGFILTTIGGGMLGSYLQNRNRFRAQQEMVFEQTAQQLDRRRHQTRLLLYAFKGDTTYGSKAHRWSEYAAMVDNWNENVNRMTALVARYYGGEVRACYQVVATSLVNLGVGIRRNVDPDLLLKDERQIQDDIQVFDVYLLDHMGRRLPYNSGKCVERSVEARASGPAKAP